VTCMTSTRARRRVEPDVDDEYTGEEENHLKHDEEFLSRSERDIQGTSITYCTCRPPRSCVLHGSMGYVIMLLFLLLLLIIITFRVSRRRREMYRGHPRLCVCPRPHAYTVARTRT